MKHFLSKIISQCFYSFFLLTCTAVIIAVFNPDRYLWSINLTHDFDPNGPTAKRFHDADKYEGSLDFLFVGSSHVDRALSPAIFRRSGYSAFNIGSASQTLDHSLVLIKHYLPRLEAKYVILDTYYTQFQKGISPVESELKLMSNVSSQSLKWSVLKQDLRIESLLIFAYSELIQKLHPQNTSPKKVTMHYEGNGFVTYRGPLLGKKMDARHIDLDEQAFELLDSIQNVVQQNGAQLILVHVPFPVFHQEAISNYSFYENKMRAYADSAGVPWLDYNGQLATNIPDSCFYDSSHLLPCGVDLFNERLLEDLKERSLID